MRNIELIRSCIGLLRHKFHIGACTAKVPLQDTRKLLGIVQQRGVEALDDVSAEYLVALLLYVLRESDDSLIPSEMYESVVNSDLSGVPGEVLSKMTWLARMENKRLSLFMEVLGFLWQAATSESMSDTSSKQMAAIFAPVLCKPGQGVFLSAQESEDLSHLIAVIAFFIDQYDFLESYARPFELSTPPRENSRTPPKNGWRLQSPTTVMSSQIDEMKIVRSLVSWVVGTSLRPQSTTPAADTSSGPSTPVDRQELSPTIAQVEQIPSTPPPTTHSTSTTPATPSTLPAAAHDSPRPAVAQNRRALLRTCKMLKARIKRFEEAYKDEHGTLPKQDGDHEMVEVYAEYRRLKRLIREESVTTIQRWFRRHNTRRRLKRARNPTVMTETESEPESDGRLSEDFVDTSVKRPDKTIRELTRRKAELKQQLKAFNTEFVKRHQREPEKADKEVIRHLYEEYNSIKAELKNVVGGSGSRQTSRPAHDEHKRRRSGDVIDSQASAEPADADDDRVAALTKEKQALHTFLKEYEKNFQAKYHRAVFSHEDIVPVAREFERYQEVKQLLSTLQPKSRHRAS